MSSIKHGDRVYAIKDMPFTWKSKARMIRAGTQGEVKALRELKTDDCRKALVKFKGASWPRQVNINQIGKEKPVARKSKPKPKAKGKVKPKPNTHGTRVAIYFGKGQDNLLAWAREHAAKTNVGLNRIVQDGLRCLHELETGDVHYQSGTGSAVEQKPTVEQ